MLDSELAALENEYATKDVRVFNALRELRIELRIAKRGYDELYAEKYNPVVYGHVGAA